MLRSLRWGDCPGISVWPGALTGSLHGEVGGWKEKKVCHWAQRGAVHFGDGEGAKPSMWVTTSLWKELETDSQSL